MENFVEFSKNTNDGGFEKFIQHYLISCLNFYKVEITKKSNDLGVDIIAIDTLGCKVGIQCKNWDSSVGEDVIYKLHGGLIEYGCQYGIVATTSQFTPAAIKVTNNLNIKLINKTDIDRMKTILNSNSDIYKASIDIIKSEYDTNLNKYKTELETAKKEYEEKFELLENMRQGLINSQSSKTEINYAPQLKLQQTKNLLDRQQSQFERYKNTTSESLKKEKTIFEAYKKEMLDSLQNEKTTLEHNKKQLIDYKKELEVDRQFIEEGFNIIEKRIQSPQLKKLEFLSVFSASVAIFFIILTIILRNVAIEIKGAFLIIDVILIGVRLITNNFLKTSISGLLQTELNKVNENFIDKSISIYNNEKQ